MKTNIDKHLPLKTLLYNRPAPQPVTLTDEDLLVALESVDPETKRLSPGFKAYARAVIEAYQAKQEDKV